MFYSFQIRDINRLLEEKKTSVEQMERSVKRVCRLQDPFRGQLNVLGKVKIFKVFYHQISIVQNITLRVCLFTFRVQVGHLALVRDDAAAKVISWQISGDMDCVVTLDNTTAQRIYNDTQGRQQVLPLTNVLVRQDSRYVRPSLRFETELSASASVVMVKSSASGTTNLLTP